MSFQTTYFMGKFKLKPTFSKTFNLNLNHTSIQDDVFNRKYYNKITSCYFDTYIYYI